MFLVALAAYTGPISVYYGDEIAGMNKAAPLVETHILITALVLMVILETLTRSS